MPAFDTSSLIYAWDNYPLDMFPPLWNWLGQEIGSQRIVFSQVVRDEVLRNSPECEDWLSSCNPSYLDVSQSILIEALRYKSLLGIEEDRYGEGVGENDLIIVATARVNWLELVSNEAKQTKLPQNMKTYKIPAVCGLPQVQVQCRSFLEFLRLSNQVFRA